MIDGTVWLICGCTCVCVWCVCVWCLCVSLSWNKEGPPKTPFWPHALPTDKQRLIFERKALEDGPKLAAYNIERETKKLAGMLSDDLLEGARANARDARGGEQGGIEAISTDMLFFLLTCFTSC